MNSIDLEGLLKHRLLLDSPLGSVRWSGCSLNFCIHKEFPSDADPAGLRTKLSEPIRRRGHKKGIFPGQDNQRLTLPKTHLPELLSVQILAKSK